jgi:hypothetical protein
MNRAPLIASLLLLSSAAGARENGQDRIEPAGQQPLPMVVTTDTDAYCETLSRQIDEYGRDLPRMVAELRAQGLRLCAGGQVRGGINRLRRALVVLREPAERDDQDEQEQEQGR